MPNNDTTIKVNIEPEVRQDKLKKSIADLQGEYQKALKSKDISRASNIQKDIQMRSRILSGSKTNQYFKATQTRATQSKISQRISELNPNMPDLYKGFGKDYFNGLVNKFQRGIAPGKITSRTSMLAEQERNAYNEEINATREKQKAEKKIALEKERAERLQARLELSNERKREREAKKRRKNSMKWATNLESALTRIATYKAIRSLFSFINKNIDQGTKNLYQWSKLNDGAFAKTMDNIASSMTYVTNAIGALVGPILMDLEPLITRITDGFVKLTEQASRFIAVIAGRDWYYTANKQAKEFLQTQRQILGFDVINKLSGDQNDYSSMFSKTYFDAEDLNTFEEFALKITTIFTELGEQLSATDGIQAKLKVAFTEFDPSVEFTADEAGILIKGALVGIAGGILGFKVAGASGALTGFLGGALLSIAFDTLLPSFTEKILGDDSKVVDFANMAIGAYLGARFLGGLGGNKLIGATIGATLAVAFSKLDPLAKSLEADDGEQFKKVLATLISDLGAGLGLSMVFKGNFVGGMAVITLAGILRLSLGLQTEVEEDASEILNGILGDGEIDPNVDVEAQAWRSFGEATANKLFGNNSTTQTETVAEAIEDVFARSNKTPFKATLKANGGYVNTGSLFIAGEAGPELVTSMNGQSAVFNMDQLTGYLAQANDGVVGAVIAGANMIVSSVNNIPTPSIKIGDRDIYNASKRGERIVGKNVVTGA